MLLGHPLPIAQRIPVQLGRVWMNFFLPKWKGPGMGNYPWGTEETWVTPNSPWNSSIPAYQRRLGHLLPHGSSPRAVPCSASWAPTDRQLIGASAACEIVSGQAHRGGGSRVPLHRSEGERARLRLRLYAEWSVGVELLASACNKGAPRRIQVRVLSSITSAPPLFWIFPRHVSSADLRSYGLPSNFLLVILILHCNFRLISWHKLTRMVVLMHLITVACGRIGQFWTKLACGLILPKLPKYPMGVGKTSNG